MDATDHPAVNPAEAALAQKAAVLAAALMQMADREMHASNGALGPSERDDMLMFTLAAVATALVNDAGDIEGPHRATWLIRHIADALTVRLTAERLAALGLPVDEEDEDRAEDEPTSSPAPTGRLQ